MILIKITLHCEGCSAQFEGSKSARDVPRRRDVEELRSDAARKGWARFRPKNTAANADYCKECAHRMSLAKRGAKCATPS